MSNTRAVIVMLYLGFLCGASLGVIFAINMPLFYKMIHQTCPTPPPS